MLDSDPTPTQVRQLQNRLEALLDDKEHRSALKEGAKSWSWSRARKKLRKKRRAFDHNLVQIYEHSPVPTPDDLYSRFDKVWNSEVEDGSRPMLHKGLDFLTPVSTWIHTIEKANEKW
jgi:hypothetical protein